MSYGKLSDATDAAHRLGGVTAVASSLIEQELIGRRPNSTGWYRINCPLCEDSTGKDDHRSSLSVSAKGYYQCWKCEARGWIDTEADDFEPIKAAEPEPAPDIELPFDFEPLGHEPGISSIAFAPARAFLQRRLGDRWLDLVRLTGIGVSFRMKRVVIPMPGEYDRLIGWVARDYTDVQQIKYRTAPGMKRTIYNLAAIRTPPYALGVEGMFDALPFLPRAFSFLGKPSDDHIASLEAATVPIVICLDGDARDTTWATVRRLQMRGVDAHGILLRHTDPGNFARNPELLTNQVEKLINV